MEFFPSVMYKNNLNESPLVCALHGVWPHHCYYFDLHVHVFKFVCIQQNILKIIIIAIDHSGYAECLHYDYID